MMYFLRLAALAALSLLLLAGFSSCTTYHKVAVWYKYRNDFHLPKHQDDRQHTMAKGQAVYQASPQAEDESRIITEPTRTPRKPALLAGIIKKRHARQAVASVPDEGLSASIGAAASPLRKPVWAMEEPQQATPAGPDNRPFHWSAMVGFVLSLCILPSFAFFLSYLFSLFFLVLIGAFVFSIMSLFHTGPERPYRGRGLGIAGLVISIVDVFLLFLLLILVLIALATL